MAAATRLSYEKEADALTKARPKWRVEKEEETRKKGKMAKNSKKKRKPARKGRWQKKTMSSETFEYRAAKGHFFHKEPFLSKLFIN